MNQHSPIMRSSFVDGSAKKLFIDGEWIEARSGKTFESVNPSNGQPLDRLALADGADVDLAVRAARRAFDGPWSRFRPKDRQRVILKLADLVEQHADEIAATDSIDMGGPMHGTRFMVDFVIDLLRYSAAQTMLIVGDTLQNSQPFEVATYSTREPLGVVGGIIPWNAPLFCAAAKVAPVLATGCTLVLKCAEQASLTPLWLGQLAIEAGIPPGVINVVTGFGDAGAALASHMDVDKISFTGSTETGRHIIRASAGNIKRLTLELGGKSPDIVFADADLDAAVPSAAMAAFANSGQVCAAGSRLFVEASIYEEFTQRVAEFAKILKVGDSLDPDTQIGPLVSHDQVERVGGFLASGVAQGARALAGGARICEGPLAAGFFVPPTVFADVRDEMDIAREEIFGPVISAMPFEEIDDVIRRANDTSYGLSSAVWTRDIDKAQKVTKALRAGTVVVNGGLMIDPGVPSGGYKMSGYGRENGPHQLDAYLETKSVWIKTN